MHGKSRNTGIGTRHGMPGNVVANTPPQRDARFDHQRGRGSVDVGVSSSHSDVSNRRLSYSRNSTRSGERANDADSQ